MQSPDLEVPLAPTPHPLATLGGNSPQSLGTIGVNVMNSIKSAGLTGYYVNLMAMDYGSAIASNCTLGSNGKLANAVHLYESLGFAHRRTATFRAARVPAPAA